MTWLSRFVDHVRVAAFDGEARVMRLPDGRVHLMFRVLDDASGDLTVAGPRTRALFKRKSGIARVVMIALKPGWASQLVGVPASALTDRIVYIEDLWGRAGAELSAQLLEARSPHEVVERISHALAARSERVVEPAAAPLARRAVRLLEAQDVPIASVASQLGVTPRHLRRAFIESIGVGPKDFARSVRLHRAVKRAGSADWARIATDVGYYDQAHLISEFRALVGLTPRAFAQLGDHV